MKHERTATESQLAGFMTYVSEEGIDFDRFVEQGGRLVGAKNMIATAGLPPWLREKIDALHRTHPRLARQLEFLAEIVAGKHEGVPAATLREAAFALVYAANDADLIPDQIPEIGYVDDAAVVAAVLERHDAVFARCSTARGLDWVGLRSKEKQR